jgi:hypothetical protein
MEDLLSRIVDQLGDTSKARSFLDRITGLDKIYTLMVQGLLRTRRKPNSVVFVEAGTNSRMQDVTGASDFVGSLT